MNTSMKLGKEFELKFLYEIQHAIVELKRTKCKIFLPLVDDAGIDFIIRVNKDVYQEIQVKARDKKHLFTISKLPNPKEHKHYWFVFYYQDDQNSYKHCILTLDQVREMLKKKKSNHITINKNVQSHDLEELLKG